jgi:hypothetical protein
MREIIQISSRDSIINKGNRTKLTITFDCDDELDQKSFQVYDNQLDIARQVLSSFQSDRKIVNIAVVAHTQSGKTGTMLAILKIIAIELDIVPIENVYIITGLSSSDWKDQTIKSFPDDCGMRDRIFHRQDLKKLFNEQIKQKKNVLILMDEIQLAAKPGQTLDKCFKDFGLQKLYENDIKIVEFSATPDGVIYDLHASEWENASKIILANPGPGYFGSFDYLENRRVRQYKDLCGYDDATGIIDPVAKANVRELEEFVKNYSNPKYHIIRTSSSPHDVYTRDNFRDVFGDSCAYKTYDGSYVDIENINNILSIQPLKHTFIFVKQLLRCSNDLKTKAHIGIVYELFTKGSPSNSVVTQGLLGRVTGYNVPNDILVWTDIETIERYKALWDADFSKEARIKWKSATTKNSRGVTVSTGTFNNTISNSSNKPANEVGLNLYRIYDNEYVVRQVCKFLDYNYRSTGENAEGFRETSMNNKTGVKSLQTAITKIRSAYGTNNGKTTFRTCYPCYVDITDQSSLRFVVIIRPTTDQSKLVECDIRFKPITL